MEESNYFVKPWGKFKIDLCNLLVHEEMKQMVLLVRGKIAEMKREKLKEPIDVLEALEDAGEIDEDKTGPLEDILRTIDNVEALEDLRRYCSLRRKYRENVKLLSGKHDPLFVGRDDEIRRIIDVFGRSANLVTCVCLYGLAGTGKTTLAVETSAIYKELLQSKPRLIKVDLRKRSTVTDAGVALMSSVGRQVASKDFDPSMVNEWINSCTQQENVIVMDNADELLQPLSLSRDHFVNMIADLITLQNPKVKIIITSRYAMRFPSLNEKPNYEEIELKALRVRESIRLLVKEFQMSQGTEKTIDENTAEEIVNHCGNNPQALRAVAKRIKTSGAESVAKMLRKPQLASRVLDPGFILGSTSLETDEEDKVNQNLVLRTLKTTFDMLPGRLQESLVKLSVFPGSFDKHKAKVILGMGDMDVVELEIDDLRQWSLVECEEFRGFEFYMEERDKQYMIHPLIRTICMVEGMKGEKHNPAFASALDRMCTYVTQLMEELATEGHKNYPQSLNRFEEEKPIVTNYLEMDMGETFAGLKIASPLLEEEESAKERTRLTSSDHAENIFHLFECFMETEQLEQYFRCKVKHMYNKGEKEAWVLLSGWLADQYVAQAKYEEALVTIKEPMSWLEAQPEPLSKDAELAKAQCLAMKGRYFTESPQYNYKKAIQFHEEALAIRRKHLDDNSMTARVLNYIGHTYHKKEDASNSKSYHEQAWEMIARITNNHPEQHFDAPTFALNIGTAYHALGNSEMDKMQKSKAREYYLHAISFYDKAQEMQRKLRLEGNHTTAVILKNKAMSYCEMEEYNNALPLAVKASELRKKVMGTHPHTARSLYFAGSIYHSLGKQEKKATKAPGEEIESFQNALKFYKDALKYEWKLGPSRRSWEYDDLKKDFRQLLKLMHEDSQPYERLFHRAEQGGFDGAMPTSVQTDEAGASSSSESPKRKLTGLEDLPESPKRTKCVLS